MKKVTIDGKVFNVPQSWGECTAAQLHALLTLQLVNPAEREDPAEGGRLKMLALKVIMPGLEAYVKDLHPDQLFNLGRLTGWIWSSKITAKPFESFSLPDANGRDVVYLLPEDNFSNSTAVEVAMANIHYLQFTRPDRPQQLAVLSLIATLCRPERPDIKKFRKSDDWNGDRREVYNTIKADERAKEFATLPFSTIMAITQYFGAMNGRFLEQYKDVYEPDPDTEAEAPLYENGEGLITTLMDIAGADVFGDFEKVCMQNSHTVWLYLRDNNLKIKRAKARAEREQLEQ